MKLLKVLPLLFSLVANGAYEVNPTTTGASVSLEKLGNSTYSTLQHMQNQFHSAGWGSGGTITSNGDGTAAVTAGTLFIRATDSSVATIFFADFAAVNPLSLTDNANNFIYVDYNAGTPTVTASTTEPTEHHTKVLLGNVYRSGTTLHINSAIKTTVINHAAHMVEFNKEVMPYAKASGGSLTESGTRNIAISAGDYWHGLTEFTTAAIDTSGAGTFTYYYRDGVGGWTSVASATQINNTQYDDSDGTLGTLSNNNYGVHWVYRETDGDLAVLYGQGNYSTLVLAQAANAPTTVPGSISASGFLVGRIIILKSAATFTEVLNADTMGFQGSAASNHNELGGLQGGTTAQYYHLTAAEQAALGTGAGALNLMNLDSAYAQEQTDNQNFESTIGTWASYADAAGTEPVDMTAGSPNTTIARSTSTPMNGTAHALVTVTTGATRQGEGVSNLVYVPPAYRGRSLELTFPYRTTGTISEDDFKLYVYDVTNSVLITPFTAGKILGANGMAKAVFPVSTNTAQIRVGVHIARASNTGAVTIEFDDVMLSPFTMPVGLAGSNWQSYTPTGSWVSNTTYTGYWRRVGDAIDLQIKVATSGAPTAAQLTFSLPSGLNFDTAKITGMDGASVLPAVGYGQAFDSGTASYEVQAAPTNGSTTTLSVRRSGGTVNATSPFTFGASDAVSIEVRGLPVSGWDSNVSMAESSTFQISNIIANGTRVTATPTKLGEYRTLIKDNAATTFSDTDGSGKVTVANGMRLYSVSGTGAGTSTEPNRWVFFVGKNKNVKLQMYGTAGRTGTIYHDYAYIDGSLNTFGTQLHYDPTSGLAVVQMAQTGSGDNRFLGWDGSTGTASGLGTLTTAYFDVIVSENALAVGTQQPRSMVRLQTGNGHGSTNTKIRRYSTTIESIGSAILYADSATLGASFTILEPGVYAMSATDRYSAGAGYIGFSINSAELTTHIATITAANRLAYTQLYGSGADFNSVATTVFLNAGDVIRPHTSGQEDNTDGRTHFTITKVSN